MDARFINTFLESARTLFSTMLSAPVTFGKPHVHDRLTKYDVSGIIGLSGDVVGSVVLCLPKASALEIVSRFAGSPLEFGGSDFADAIGELVNMIAGGAKAKFEGKNVNISCPSVVVASVHQVQTPSAAACICIPCGSPLGDFAINLAIQSQGSALASHALAAAGAH
ncbi:MAG: chemotaxis protein CheX [Planctomycetes bacterium]|nr:chemotaxis protein CheX [Planctomycetota bacterium]